MCVRHKSVAFDGCRAIYLDNYYCRSQCVQQYTLRASMPGTPAECTATARWCAILVGVEPKKNSLFPCVHVVKYEFAYKFISSLLHSGRKSSAATFKSKMNPALAPRWLREYNNHHIITGALNGNTPELALVSAPHRLKLSPFQSAPLRQTPSHVRVEHNPTSNGVLNQKNTFAFL